MVCGIVITDRVPVSVTVASRKVASSVEITSTGGISYVWKVENLSAGEGGVITITGRLSGTLPGGYVFTNTAVITTTAVDIVPGNNASSAAVTVRFVTAVYPPAESHDAALDTTVTITAGGTVSQASVTTRTFFVHGGFQGHLDGSFGFGSDGVAFDPVAILHPGERVMATASSGMLDSEGTPDGFGTGGGDGFIEGVGMEAVAIVIYGTKRLQRCTGIIELDVLTV